jgi:phosphate/sulfate permease
MEIAASWVLSPLLSGLVSASLYMVVDFAVLRRVFLLRIFGNFILKYLQQKI